MPADYRIRSLSAWTMFIFGILALILGLLGILNPALLLNLLGLLVPAPIDRAPGDYTLAFATASSMASFNMGVYYVLAAFTSLRKFYWWTVPFRMVTFTVFTLGVVSGTMPQAFIGVAVWELIGALATGGALLYERGRSAVTA